MSRLIKAGTNEELRQAVEKALPGDVIVMKNGIWTDVELELKTSGTPDQPITIKAEAPGEAVLTGASALTFAGEYVVVEGLFFKDGVQPGRNGSDTVIRFLKESSHCRLSETAIIDYHPANPEKKYFWVTIDGSHHRVNHCYFKGKYYAGQLLRNMKYSSHNLIDGNYFVDIPAYGINGLEIIQVMGIGSDGELGSAGGEHVLIENNLFERADGECEEVISLKSNHDTVRNNTFKESIGGLVIRSGHNTVVEGNYFIGGQVGGTKGIRITGEDNIVKGNYLTGLQGFGISVMSGEYIDDYLTDQWQPTLRAGTPLGRVPVYNWSKNNTIADNVLIHNDGVDLDIGIGYKTAWPSKQRVLLPESNRIADNVIVKEKGRVYTAAQQDASVMNISFAPNDYVNNRIDSQPSSGMPEGFTFEAIELQRSNNGIQEPLDGRGLSAQGPLTEDDAGPEWTKQKRRAGEPLFQARDQFATVERVPWNTDRNTAVLCAGSSDMFIRSMRTKLDVRRRDLCPLEFNGEILLPVQAVAERLGFATVTTMAGAAVEEIRIRRGASTCVLSEGRCTVVSNGEEKGIDHAPVRYGNVLFLQAKSIAELLGKALQCYEQGLVVLTDPNESVSSFDDDVTRMAAFELFKVTASSFDKEMTIPPEGRSHGKIPAYTLQEEPDTYWASYGDGQWIRYDLGRSVEVGSVAIAFLNGEACGYSADIEASDNGFDWTPISSVVSDSDELKPYPVQAVFACYVRIVGRANRVGNANRIRQVQMYSVQGEALL
ncbi:chondroitinase-B domain-containing protein [Paenibacillus sp. NPDC056579]|uniref:chondroitinase-B domain-containing protein n=1 Tax=Paenibacillus sp. NPDC056579 TaxID=3345871 RepID=UPI0036BC2247